MQIRRAGSSDDDQTGMCRVRDHGARLEGQDAFDQSYSITLELRLHATLASEHQRGQLATVIQVATLSVRGTVYYTVSGPPHSQWLKNRGTGTVTTRRDDPTHEHNILTPDMSSPDADSSISSERGSRCMSLPIATQHPGVSLKLTAYSDV